ncbi:MAG: hypothetical protein RR806_09240 [Oscillospiraceae bacterium]
MKKQIKYYLIFILSVTIIFFLIFIIGKNEYNYTISAKKIDEKGIEIPIISNLSNEDTQNKINDLLQKSALFYVDTENDNQIQQFYDTKRCDEILSVAFYGTIFYTNAIHPINFFHTLNIDVKSGEIIENDEIIKITNEVLLETLEKEWVYPNESEYKENKKLFLENQINNNEINLNSQNSPNDTINVYLTDKNVGVRINLPYDMGSYVVIEK